MPNIFTTDPDLEAAIEVFNIHSYLAEQGLLYRGTRGELCLSECPRCGAEWKLYINERTKKFICFKCSDAFSGTLLSFIIGVEGCSRYSAVNTIKQQSAGTTWVHKADIPAPLTEDVALPSNYRFLEDMTNPDEQPYWRYLINRRVDPSVAYRYGMGYVRTGMYVGRVFVPVMFQDRLLNWIARDITGRADRKVLTPPGNEQGSILFNFDRLARAHTIVITEGVFDALRVPEMCVATFGKRLTTEQLGILVKAGTKEVVFAWDNDAWKDTTRVAWEIKPFFESVRIARLPDSMDPSDMEAEDVRFAVDAAESVTDWHRLEGQLTALRKGNRGKYSNVRAVSKSSAL